MSTLTGKSDNQKNGYNKYMPIFFNTNKVTVYYIYY